ncbi:MAG: CHAD domain-containing protein [Cyclobacteriaceae bacterium]|nr:CHAD domain-containing protein [Cyclobacteriaceae bacterium]
MKIIQQSIYTVAMNRYENRIAEYFVSQYRNVLVSITNTLDKPSTENFHALRISLKRIRFVAKLVSGFDKKRSPRWVIPFTNLFDLAGRIREDQVQLSILNRFNHNETKIAKTIMRSLASRIRIWPRSIMPDLLRIIRSYPTIMKSIRLSSLSVNQHQQDLTNLVIRKFSMPLRNDQLHHRRRILKWMLYSIELNSASKRKFSKLCSLRSVAALEDAIGEWHDLVVFQQRIQSKGKKPLVKKLLHEMTRKHQLISLSLPKLLKPTKSASAK